jgi:hypothetical protein
MSGESAIVNPKTVMDWKCEELLKIINRYKPKDTLMSMKLDSFIISSLVRQRHTKVILAMVQQNQNRQLLFC